MLVYIPSLFQNMPNETEKVPPFSAEKQIALNENNSPVVSAVDLPNGVDDELATKDRDVTKKKGTCKPGKISKIKRICVTITIIWQSPAQFENRIMHQVYLRSITRSTM